MKLGIIVLIVLLVCLAVYAYQANERAGGAALLGVSAPDTRTYLPMGRLDTAATRYNPNPARTYLPMGRLDTAATRYNPNPDAIVVRTGIDPGLRLL